MKAGKAVLWNESGCKEANPKFFCESTCKLNGNMLHYWGVGGFVFSEANSERNFSGTATEDRTGLARNHVRIWVVVPPRTAKSPWFCWVFVRWMIFLTSLSNGFSKKLNNDCFPRFRGWTYTERYRSGHNGADSKSWSLSGSLHCENPWFYGVFRVFLT